MRLELRKRYNLPQLQTEPSHQVAKGTQEVGKEGQSLTQPELPEAIVESKGTQEVGKEGQSLTQPELPEYHEAKGTQEVKEGEKQGQALVQPELPEYKEPVSQKELKNLNMK